jgi:hypothetical protein
MNRKAREEWEKKQAEADKLRKLNDVGSTLCLCGSFYLVDDIILSIFYV